MRKTAYTQKDLSWVKWSAKQIKKFAEDAFAYKKKTYEEVKSISPDERTFENTVYALANAEGSHANTFHYLSLLGEVSVKKEIRDAVHEVTVGMTDKFVELEYDRGLYSALLEYVEGNFAHEKKTLKSDDVKLMEAMLRDYRRMGFDLKAPEQKKLKTLLKKSSKLGNNFGKNINDYQDHILCTKEELSGLSDRIISSFPLDRKTGKYKVTLEYPHINPFLSEANNREKRKELATKNLKKGGKKNLAIIEELVKLRAEISGILGYKHHADFRTETRMAKNAKIVEDFQNKLLKKVIPLATRDLVALRAHAKTLGINTLEHYDIPYVATSLKKKLYDLNPEEIRGYFELSYVLKQMLELFGNIFSFIARKTSLKTWHKDVVVYEILEKNKKSLIGYIAFDLFPREGKFGHACCCDTVICKEKNWNSDEYVTPFTVIICNFPAPSKKTPSLISLGEVKTLFHEFGHSLHMTFSTARHESQGGSNVAWDFVETPSQIMESFLWNDAVLKRFSKHHQTGKAMTAEMRKKILDSMKFQEAYGYLRQMILGKLDFDLHTGKVHNASAAYRQMMMKYTGLELPEKETLFPAGFGHLVGYDAGYYSYLWALVFAKDAFSEFEKDGIASREVGMRWRKEVLEKGSSEDEVKLIQNFLKRESNDAAFLKALES